MKRVLAGMLAWIALSGIPAASAAEKLNMMIPTKALSLSPIMVAVDGDAFKKRGIDMTLTEVQGGTLPLTAMIAGDAQFASLADDGFMAMVGTGKLICVYVNANSFTQNLQVRNPFLESHHVTFDIPWQERVRRMKGITMGVLALGGSSDLAGRWLWHEAGLDYKTDMTIVRVGALPSLVASLKQGATDGFVLSSPAAEILQEQGIGKAAVRFDEVAQWKDEPFETLEVLRDYLPTHKDLVRRVVAAIAEGQQLIYDHPAEAAAILHKGSYSSLDEKLLASSLKSMHVAFRQEKLSAARWESAVAVHAASNPKVADVRFKEGVDWTNDYYP
ncbi:MAG: ABC transporter substrate-binding protein [Stellaceae bacterium]